MKKQGMLLLLMGFWIGLAGSSVWAGDGNPHHDPQEKAMLMEIRKTKKALERSSSRIYSLEQGLFQARRSLDQELQKQRQIEKESQEVRARLESMDASVEARVKKLENWIDELEGDIARLKSAGLGRKARAVEEELRKKYTEQKVPWGGIPYLEHLLKQAQRDLKPLKNSNFVANAKKAALAKLESLAQSWGSVHLRVMLEEQKFHSHPNHRFLEVQREKYKQLADRLFELYQKARDLFAEHNPPYLMEVKVKNASGDLCYHGKWEKGDIDTAKIRRIQMMLEECRQAIGDQKALVARLDQVQKSLRSLYLSRISRPAPRSWEGFWSRLLINAGDFLIDLFSAKRILSKSSPWAFVLTAALSAGWKIYDMYQWYHNPVQARSYPNLFSGEGGVLDSAARSTIEVLALGAKGGGGFGRPAVLLGEIARLRVGSLSRKQLYSAAKGALEVGSQRLVPVVKAVSQKLGSTEFTSFVTLSYGKSAAAQMLKNRFDDGYVVQEARSYVDLKHLSFQLSRAVSQYRQAEEHLAYLYKQQRQLLIEGEELWHMRKLKILVNQRVESREGILELTFSHPVRTPNLTLGDKTFEVQPVGGQKDRTGEAVTNGFSASFQTTGLPDLARLVVTTYSRVMSDTGHIRVDRGKKLDGRAETQSEFSVRLLERVGYEPGSDRTHLISLRPPPPSRFHGASDRCLRKHEEKPRRGQSRSQTDPRQ